MLKCNGYCAIKIQTFLGKLQKLKDNFSKLLDSKAFLENLVYGFHCLYQSTCNPYNNYTKFSHEDQIWKFQYVLLIKNAFNQDFVLNCSQT